MKRVGASFLAVVVLAMACTGSGGTERNRGQQTPNFLVVIADDQPQGTMSVMPKTMRWLADGGVTFTHAFATTPQCCPSRATIYSGRYDHNTGVKTNDEALKLNQHSTVQSYLHRQGYETAYFGKYLNPWPLRRRPPFFDRWAVIPKSPFGYYGGKWNVEGRVRQPRPYGTDFLARLSQRFLESVASGAKPWLLFIAPAAPHPPAVPERKYREAPVPRWDPNAAVREKDLSDKPPFVQSSDVQPAYGRDVRARQLRTLMSVDDLMGRVHKTLQQTGQLSNTLVLYISDNGFLWGQHHRRAKAVPYTPSIQIPFFASWPGHLPEGAKDNRLVGNLDIAPTIMAAAGARPNPVYPMDGHSLLKKRFSRPEILTEYWHSSHYASDVPSWASIRTVRYQYVEYRRKGRVIFREYYDLRRDPFQVLNLLANPSRKDDPRNLRELHRRLRRLRRCEGAACP